MPSRAPYRRCSASPEHYGPIGAASFRACAGPCTPANSKASTTRSRSSSAWLTATETLNTSSSRSVRRSQGIREEPKKSGAAPAVPRFFRIRQATTMTARRYFAAQSLRLAVIAPGPDRFARMAGLRCADRAAFPPVSMEHRRSRQPQAARGKHAQGAARRR